MPTLRQTIARVLTDTTALQKLFDTNTTGAIDLVAGTYTFEAYVALTAMSATSGNASFDVLGAGTATTSKYLAQVVGVDSTGITAMAAAVTTMTTASASAASIVSGAVNTVLTFSIRGSFEVTVGGTIIPSVALVTGGVTPNVIAGTYFSCTRIGEAATGVFTEGFRTIISNVLAAGVRTITYSDGTVRTDKEG